MQDTPDLDGIITQMFNNRLSAQEMLDMLRDTYRMSMSLRTLRRRLASLGCVRREYDSIETINTFIVTQLESNVSITFGYRVMHALCLVNGIRARKEDIRSILATLQPEMSQSR